MGEVIAADLVSWEGDPPPVRVPERPGDPAAPLQVRVGPVDPDDAWRLISSLEANWASERSTMRVRTEQARGGALACVELDLPS